MWIQIVVACCTVHTCVLCVMHQITYSFNSIQRINKEKRRSFRKSGSLQRQFYSDFDANKNIKISLQTVIELSMFYPLKMGTITTYRKQINERKHLELNIGLFGLWCRMKHTNAHVTYNTYRTEYIHIIVQSSHIHRLSTPSFPLRRRTHYTYDQKHKNDVILLFILTGCWSRLFVKFGADYWRSWLCVPWHRNILPSLLLSSTEMSSYDWQQTSIYVVQNLIHNFDRH